MTDSHRQRLPQDPGTVDLLFLSSHATLHTWGIAHRRSDDKNRREIGINDDEKKNQQDVVINIRILYHAEKAVSFNVIDEALNYRTITKKVIKHVESNRFLLLERMTDEVLSLVMDHPQVMWADVTIDKPHALRFSDSVSITLSARREGYAGAHHPH